MRGMEEPTGESAVDAEGVEEREDATPAAADAVALPDDPAERVRHLVELVVGEMALDATVELEENDEEIRVFVKGDDVGLLIGKHGATIDALQHLAIRLAYSDHRGDRKAVVVDAAGYRDRREAALQRAADQAVSEALRYGRAVELEPMGPYERRTVHTYLRDRTDVQTHSEGDEPDRRLVVTPVRGDE
jgi:spoIIIJ-associated protein